MDAEEVGPGGWGEPAGDEPNCPGALGFLVSQRESRGTTNIMVGTQGSLRLHALVRPFLVRQVDQFDTAVVFMRKRYDDGRLRVFWTEDERVEWESFRRRFHKNGVFQ